MHLTADGCEQDASVYQLLHRGASAMKHLPFLVRVVLSAPTIISIFLTHLPASGTRAYFKDASVLDPDGDGVVQPILGHTTVSSRHGPNELLLIWLNQIGYIEWVHLARGTIGLVGMAELGKRQISTAVVIGCRRDCQLGTVQPCEPPLCLLVRLTFEMKLC